MVAAARRERLFDPFEERHFSFAEELDADMLAGRIASVSFVAAAPPEARRELDSSLRIVAERLGGCVILAYVTRAYVSLRSKSVTLVYAAAINLDAGQGRCNDSGAVKPRGSMRKGLYLAACALALTIPSAALADVAHVGYPSSIASTGDSITRAFNTCAFPFVRLPSELLVDGNQQHGQQSLPPDPRCEPCHQRP